MALAAPVFEEGSKCAVCSCSFGTFKRRHHCRACGRSLCNEHSSSQKPLPQYGLHAPVRVCKECYEEKSSAPVDSEAVPDEVDDYVSRFTELQIDPPEPVVPGDSKPETLPETDSVSSLKAECTCGMPLCICRFSDSPKDPPPVQQMTAPRSKKVSRPSLASKQTRPAASTSAKTYPSLFFSSMQGSSQNPGSYDSTGEGLREAIKNKDQDSVKDLLSKGVDPNYVDKQGMSLLHLAAMFNLSEISFILLDAGANPHAKNAQGETPLDCAQATLQYQLRQKLEDSTTTTRTDSS